MSKIWFDRSPSDKLVISAAASLKPVMEEIRTIYQQKYPQLNLVYNFGASGLLAQQIEQGASIDLFFCASSWQMEQLHKKQLIISHSRRDILQNQIAVITAKNNANLTNFSDLTTSKVAKIVVGDPNIVPAGKYAQEIFLSKKIWPQIQSKLVFAKDEQAILAYIELEHGDVGLVYASSLFNSRQFRVISFVAPQFHQPINYPIAIVADSQKYTQAQKFIDFLMTSQTKEVFLKYKFQPSF